MLLVFVDESGRSQRYYYIGALIADQGSAIAIERSLDNIGRIVAHQVQGFRPAAEFHAYDLFHGLGDWSSVPVALRVRVSRLAVKSIRESGAKFIFRGVDLKALQRRYNALYDPHALVLSQALESVQRFINSHHRKREHALVLADEHHTAPDSRTRFSTMKSNAVKGHTKIPLDNLLDTIYFGPSHHSRLLQGADIASFFMNRWMTVTHPQAQKAMNDIQNNLQIMTQYQYVWRP